MNVRELIEVLQKADPEATVIHARGVMEDHIEVRQVMTAEYACVHDVWDDHGDRLEGGNWVVLY